MGTTRYSTVRYLGRGRNSVVGRFDNWCRTILTLACDNDLLWAMRYSSVFYSRSHSLERQTGVSVDSLDSVTLRRITFCTHTSYCNAKQENTENLSIERRKKLFSCPASD